MISLFHFPTAALILTARLKRRTLPEQVRK